MSIFLSVALSLAACGEASAPSPRARARVRPNVLLVTLDTTRADRIGCYGYGPARTPSLDGLAREGVRIEHAVASAPITAPSHASILTGLYPPGHGVRDNGSHRLADAIVTLPEQLRAAGYDTRAFVSASVLDHRYNLSQGFLGYDDDLWSEDAPSMFMIRERPGRRTVDRALAFFDRWKADPARRPFFAWVHLFDVHEPHEPDRLDRIVTTTPYDAEIAGVDRQVGRLLAALRDAHVLDDTIVIVTADHGESLGEHHEQTHAVFVYEATIRVPLILRYPRSLPRGRVYAGTMRSVDLAPTVLDLAGARPLEGIDGRSLARALRGEEAPPALAAYSESLVSELGFGMAPLFALRNGTMTYVRAPRPELYDRSTDPGELHDLAAAAPDRARAMDAELERLLDSSRTHASEVGGAPVDRATIEELQALGYVGEAGTRGAVRGMDPKDGILLYEAMNHARELLRQGRFDDAEASLREILARTPENVTAINLLALAETRRGLPDEAKALYARSLEVDPDQTRILLPLASLEADTGHLAEAAAHLDTAIERSPGFVEALIERGIVALLASDPTTAESYYRRAIAADPRFPRAYQAYGDLFFRRREFARALEFYRRALALAPDAFPILSLAAVASFRAGDDAAARAYLDRAERVRPDSFVPPYDRACLAALRGRRDEAFRALDVAAERGFAHAEIAERDPDLASLRDDPRFAAFVARVRARGARAPE